MIRVYLEWFVVPCMVVPLHMNCIKFEHFGKTKGITMTSTLFRQYKHCRQTYDGLGVLISMLTRTAE